MSNSRSVRPFERSLFLALDWVFHCSLLFSVLLINDLFLRRTPINYNFTPPGIWDLYIFHAPMTPAVKYSGRTAVKDSGHPLGMPDTGNG
ncbi:hypothetical protein CDAR_523641 [Caerostris darwini]|uniref:Uncharacterized protein n=1 Tax=Caerostris darwini TaxID=1538125 RepID=A0AAV4UAD0_9ARAC|nr:hypothetical protein CDAR_523641 [Caerostris darwini]